MCLISSILKNCNKEIYEENALIWFKQTLKLLNATPSENLMGLCLENLNTIISKSSSVEKISRELSTKGLDPFLQLITGILFNFVLLHYLSQHPCHVTPTKKALCSIIKVCCLIDVKVNKKLM